MVVSGVLFLGRGRFPVTFFWVFSPLCFSFVEIVEKVTKVGLGVETRTHPQLRRWGCARGTSIRRHSTYARR